MTSFPDLRNRLFQHYFQDRFRDALELLDGYEPADATEEEDLFFWQMCLRSRLGDSDEALSLFSEALDRGHWWSETMLRDEDLDPLRDLPEWRVLRERSAQLQSIEPVPELKPTILSPAGDGPGPPKDLVVLHGAGLRPEIEAEHWSSATELGWTVVAPQSSQRLSAAGRYGWHDLQRAQSDVTTQLREAEWRSNGGSTVLGGFSQGGGLAVHLACGGNVAVDGLVAVAPTFHWGPPEAIKGEPVDSWILLGEEDLPRILDEAKKLTDMLRGAGWPLHLKSRPDVGHAYPPAFEELLATALTGFG